MIVMLTHFPETWNPHYLSIDSSENLQVHTTAIYEANQERDWKLKKRLIFDVNIMKFGNGNNQDCH